MRKIDDLHLADSVELQLKSKHNFDAAYDVTLSAGLRDYMKKCVVIEPGDWLCQFYCKQIISMGVRRNLQATIQNWAISLQIQKWSFHITILLFLSIHHCLHNMSSQPSLLSIVATTGPLLISLNSREHVVISFHPFFKYLYGSIFPRSKFGRKPRPWRISKKKMANPQGCAPGLGDDNIQN